jgi:hypothetical protein
MTLIKGINMYREVTSYGTGDETPLKKFENFLNRLEYVYPFDCIMAIPVVNLCLCDWSLCREREDTLALNRQLIVSRYDVSELENQVSSFSSNNDQSDPILLAQMNVLLYTLKKYYARGRRLECIILGALVSSVSLIPVLFMASLLSCAPSEGDDCESETEKNAIDTLNMSVLCIFLGLLSVCSLSMSVVEVNKYMLGREVAEVKKNLDDLVEQENSHPHNIL